MKHIEIIDGYWEYLVYRDGELIHKINDKHGDIYAELKTLSHPENDGTILDNIIEEIQQNLDKTSKTRLTSEEIEELKQILRDVDTTDEDREWKKRGRLTQEEIEIVAGQLFKGEKKMFAEYIFDQVCIFGGFWLVRLVFSMDEYIEKDFGKLFTWGCVAISIASIFEIVRASCEYAKKAKGFKEKCYAYDYCKCSNAERMEHIFQCGDKKLILTEEQADKMRTML